MRHDGACPNLARRVALNEVGVDIQGGDPRGAPSLGNLTGRFVFAARYGWRAVLRVWAHLPQAPAAKRRTGSSAWMSRRMELDSHVGWSAASRPGRQPAATAVLSSVRRSATCVGHRHRLAASPSPATTTTTTTATTTTSPERAHSSVAPARLRDVPGARPTAPRHDGHSWPRSPSRPPCSSNCHR